jgi:hypothetical protein
MNEYWSLFGMLLNHVNTDEVFFHWLTPILAITFWLIRSRSCLLTLPISDLAGLIRRQVGLFLKLGLWSFKVINASRSAVILILSARFNFVAISLASLLIEDAVSGVIFLYVFVIFFWSRLLAHIRKKFGGVSYVLGPTFVVFVFGKKSQLL